MLLLMMGLAACNRPSDGPKPVPLPANPNGIPAITSTPTLASRQAASTTIWFLIDRSTSMSGCTDLGVLYHLPGFLAQIAAALSYGSDSPLQVAEVFFPYPEEDLKGPVPASQIWGELREPNILTRTASWNGYEQAMDKVAYLAAVEQKHVVLVLTDGTFSKKGEQEQDNERDEIERALRHLRQNKKAEVYAIFCTHPDLGKRAWDSPTITQTLSGMYELGNLSEWIDDLGNSLFGEWFYSADKTTQIGWVTTGTSIISLPGDTITFTLEVIPLALQNKMQIEHRGKWLDMELDETGGVFVLEDGFEHSKPAGADCKSREIRLDIEGNPVGLYVIRGYKTPPMEEPRVLESVNHNTATLTFSLAGSSSFDPSDFRGCYSQVELISVIAKASGHFREPQTFLEWRPLTTTEPGNYTGTICLRNFKGEIIGTLPVTLPVWFRPTPLHISSTAMPRDTEEKGPGLYQVSFEYNYVPPDVQPQIFLCSSLNITETEGVNKNLACGRGDCCKISGDCNIICPLPRPCPPEASGFCSNCVPVVPGPLCAPEHVAVVSSSGNSGPPTFTQVYTVTLYKCLADEERKCSYVGLLFSWSGEPGVVSHTLYFKRSGNAWILQSQ